MGKYSLQVAHAGGGCRGPMWQEQLAEKALEGQLGAQEVRETVPPFQQGQRLPMMIGLNIFNSASSVEESGFILKLRHRDFL